jgi:DNA-binding NarL/FixJ family response regulator
LNFGGILTVEFRTRVLVAEDEEFTLNLLREILTDANFEVIAVKSVSDAIKSIESFDPHAVISDLNFGVNAPSGADLLNFLHEERPWIGKVILTSHASPNLALPRGTALPPNVIYLVKSELQSIAALSNAIKDSIAKISETSVIPVLDNQRIVISQTQGEILRLMAEGYTNQAIATRRGTSLRATEALVQRTFATLGIKSDDEFNPRILAVRMWQEDKVVIK